jgi:hypothetical protein
VDWRRSMATLSKLWQHVAAGLVIALLIVAPTARSTIAAGTWYAAPGGSDSNTCANPASPCATINAAIARASAEDMIKVAAGTYANQDSTQEVVLVNKDIHLSGGWSEDFDNQDGLSVIDGQNARRGMTTAADTESTLEFFIIQNGLAPLTENPRHFGGGIYNQGVLTVTNSIITNNRTSHWGAGIFDRGTLTLDRSSVSGNFGDNNQESWGGGIYTDFGATTLIQNSAITGNKAYEGGGILIRQSNVVINNTTISGNEAYGWGGGILNGYGGTVHVNNATITNNTANYGGGGFSIGGGANYLQNTILAGNTAGYSPDCLNDDNVLTSGGYNLLGNSNGCNFPAGLGDKIDVNPMLFPLIGAPPYHPLLYWSTAIDHGNPDGCTDDQGNPLLTDQRGAARVGRCDIGAYEYDPSQDPISYCDLPILRKCSPLLYDNFSNPSSGWGQGDLGQMLLEYNQGEYRILLRSTEWWFAEGPDLQASDYTVSVDLRNISGVNGSYGIAFGGDYYLHLFYSLEIYPDGGYGVYRYDWDQNNYVALAEGYSEAIHQGSESNHLIVVRNGASIKAYANGQLLTEVSDGIYLGTRYLGLVVFSYDQPDVDIRFDNFLVYPLVCGVSNPARLPAGVNRLASGQHWLVKP